MRYGQEIRREFNERKACLTHTKRNFLIDDDERGNGAFGLSGTAAWMSVAVQQYIFGLNPTMNGLKIQPCIPDVWEEVKVTRVFRGSEYSITIDNRAKKGNRVKELLVNGKKHDGAIVEPKGDKMEIRVIMG